MTAASGRRGGGSLAGAGRSRADDSCCRARLRHADVRGRARRSVSEGVAFHVMNAVVMGLDLPLWAFAVTYLAVVHDAAVLAS